MYPNQNPRIGIPDALLEAIDSHLRLSGTFTSRQELVTHAIAEYLERAEDQLWLAS